MNKEYDNTNQGALWLRTAKSGLKYMSGTLNVNGSDYDIAMFKNNKKGNDKAPEYRLKVSDKKVKQEETKKDMSVYEDFSEEYEEELLSLPF